MPDAPAQPPSNKHAWKELRTDLWHGVILTLLVTFLGQLIEHNWWLEQLRFVAYHRIQQSLVTEGGRQNALDSIRIIDTSKIVELQQTEKPRPGGDDNLNLTPRPALTRLIRALLDRGVKAVAVDIDFSLGSNGLPRGTDDVAFLNQWCMSAQIHSGAYVCTYRDTPVLFGIGANWLKHSNLWLLEPFSSLAANVKVPEKDFRHAVFSVTSSEKGFQGEPSLELLSMGPKLAEVSGLAARLREPGPLLSWALESSKEEEVEEDSQTGVVRLTPVDYSAMEFLRKNAVITPESIDDIAKDDVDRKAVIVGNLYSGDQFYVPLLSERRPIVPGPFIHANAFVNRVQEKAPLEPTHAGRIALDVALVVLGLLMVAAVRIYYLRRYQLEIASERFERLIAILSAILAVVGSTYLVQLHRVIWDDYIWCAFLLLIHPYLAEHFWPLLTTMRQFIMNTWKVLILDAGAQKSHNGQSS